MPSKITLHEHLRKKLNTTDEIIYSLTQKDIQELERKILSLDKLDTNQYDLQKFILRKKIIDLQNPLRSKTKLISELKLLAAYKSDKALLKHPNIDNLVQKYNNLDESEFLNLLSIGALDVYIKDLENKYYSYIFLEIIDEYKAYTSYTDKLPNFNNINKNRVKPTLLKALDTIKELNNYFDTETIKSIDKIEYIIYNFSDVSKSDYESIFKSTIKLKLKNIGIKSKKTDQFYTDMRTHCKS